MDNQPGRRNAAAGLTTRLEKSFAEQHALHEEACIHGMMATLVGKVSSSPRQRLSLRVRMPPVAMPRPAQGCRSLE
jgi:hypothetical protein